jgi:WD40 repeat protein
MSLVFVVLSWTVQLRSSAQDNQLNLVLISSDETTVVSIVSGADSVSRLTVMDSQTLSVRKTITISGRFISSASLNHFGTIVAYTTGFYGGLYLFDLETEVETTLQPYPNMRGIASLDWNPVNTNLLAVALSGLEVAVFDISNPADTLFTWVDFQDTGFSRAIRWSPDGAQLAHSSVRTQSGRPRELEGNLRIWQIPAPLPVADEIVMTTVPARVTEIGGGTGIAWDATGTYVANTLGEGGIAIFSVETGELLQRLLPPETIWIYDSIWSPDNSTIAAAYTNGSYYIWDVDSGEIINRVDIPDNFPELSIVWLPSRQILGFAGNVLTIDGNPVEDYQRTLTAVPTAPPPP